MAKAKTYFCLLVRDVNGESDTSFFRVHDNAHSMGALVRVLEQNDANREDPIYIYRDGYGGVKLATRRQFSPEIPLALLFVADRPLPFALYTREFRIDFSTSKQEFLDIREGSRYLSMPYPRSLESPARALIITLLRFFKIMY